DQSRGRYPGQRRRREIHVVIAVLHPALPFPQRDDLLVAEFMAFAHSLPFCRWLALDRNLSHDRPSLLREIHGRANQNHRLDSPRLKRRHMEKNVAAHAQADRLASLNAKMVEEGKGIESALAVC